MYRPMQQPPVDRDSPQWHARMDAYLDTHIQPQVMANGYALQSVFGKTATDGFVYTVGLTARRLPEIILRYMYPDLAGILLAQLAQAVADTGWTPAQMTDGRTVTITADLARDQDAAFSFQAHDQTDNDCTVGIAARFYGRRVPAVLAVTDGWPCPPCTGQPETTCTCVFACWHKRCAIPADPA